MSIFASGGGLCDLGGLDIIVIRTINHWASAAALPRRARKIQTIRSPDGLVIHDKKAFPVPPRMKLNLYIGAGQRLLPKKKGQIGPTHSWGSMKATPYIVALQAAVLSDGGGPLAPQARALDVGGGGGEIIQG